tara:strand:- start:594 stop:1442 length:849 start_codon:yes stop_codon:yes gene_type:complete
MSTSNFAVYEKDTYLLIDGDTIVYSVGFSPNLNVEGTPPAYIYHQVKNMLNSMIEAVPAAHVRIYLTSQDKSNYRFDVAKTPGPGGQGYKAQRGTTVPPMYKQMIRDYLVEEHRAQIVEGMEADDMLGIQATKYGREATIATFDKDLHMVPCHIYDIRKKQLMPYNYVGELGGLELQVTETASGKVKKKLIGRGVAWLYAQMLLGDTVDNIPGINGCGDVGAHKLLEGLEIEADYFHVVGGKYLDTLGDGAMERFKEVAQLLWMQTNKHRCIVKRWEKLGWI